MRVVTPVIALSTFAIFIRNGPCDGFILFLFENSNPREDGWNLSTPSSVIGGQWTIEGLELASLHIKYASVLYVYQFRISDEPSSCRLASFRFPRNVVVISYHGNTTISSLGGARWLAQALAPTSAVEVIETVLRGLSV